MASEKQTKYDVDGYDIITSALIELLNQYPGIESGQKIEFSTLEETGGQAMFPVSGAIVENEHEDITGHVKQKCLYPFYVIYRASGLSSSRKIKVKEWLDNLGKWLEKQTIIVNGEEYVLEEYPSLTGGRKFLSITRQTPAYLDNFNEDKSEDWAVYISAKYQNEFNR